MGGAEFFMNKTILLTAASVIALNAGNTFAGTPARPISDKVNILWNQNSNDAGTSINSQNYTTSYTSNSDQAADDFVIPTGTKWTIREVDVTGAYYKGSGPASSENVMFYKNSSGKPGKPVRNGTFNNLNGGMGPSFSIKLPGKGITLKGGHYWVSVVANEVFIVAGLWGWEVNGVLHGDRAMWQNPGGGFARCYSWAPIEQCIGSGPDLMFELRGNAK